MMEKNDKNDSPKKENNPLWRQRLFDPKYDTYFHVKCTDNSSICQRFYCQEAFYLNPVNAFPLNESPYSIHVILARRISILFTSSKYKAGNYLYTDRMSKD